MGGPPGVPECTGGPPGVAIGAPYAGSSGAGPPGVPIDLPGGGPPGVPTKAEGLGVPVFPRVGASALWGAGVVGASLLDASFFVLLRSSPNSVFVLAS